MTAAECIDEIERVLLATGSPPSTLTSRPSGQRDRDSYQNAVVVRDVEKLIEKFRVYGDRR